MSDFSNATNTHRKGAIKLKETLLVNGHRMTRHYFRSPTYCTHCGQFIWGVTKSQGYKCIVCQFSCHLRCCEFILLPCKGSDVGVTSGQENPHNFATVTILAAKSCDHCGSFVFSKGLKCNKCLSLIHPKCKDHVPNLCGVSCTERRGRIRLSMKIVDGKIIAEILEARNLPAMDPNGLADPYVKIKLENPNRKAKTRTIKNTRNPMWNEKINLKLSPTDLSTKLGRVVIEVWDYDSTSGNDFIGACSYLLSEVADGKFSDFQWFKLLKLEEGKHMYIIILETPLPTIPEGADAEEIDSLYSIDRFKIISVIGRGSFGKVMLAVLISSKHVFAIKALRKDSLIIDDDVECAINEREIMSSISSQFCVQLFCSFQSYERLYLVLEYASGGDLMGRLISIGKFSEREARFYLEQTAEALIFMHDKYIIHRDIKLENLLLDMEGNIKLADFGMATRVDNGFAKTFCGTPEYIAPEIVRREKYGKSVDWWSFGILGYHMLKGAPPFMTDDDALLFTMIVHSEVKYPKYFSPEAKSLIAGFLTKDPGLRLGSGPDGAEMIRKEELFAHTMWGNLTDPKNPPPFKPCIKSQLDTANFGIEFTEEPLKPSHVDKQVLVHGDHTLFKNFNYINNKFPLSV